MVKLWLSLITSIFLLSGINSITYGNPVGTPIVQETELTKWGYKSTKSNLVQQSKWEIDNFGSASKHHQKIKSTQEVTGWADAYYRFTITRIVFQNDASAQKRLKEIYAHPPEVNTKMQPEYTLRKGFRKGKTVYFIATDVVKFEREELPRVFELLKAYKEDNL